MAGASMIPTGRDSTQSAPATPAEHPSLPLEQQERRHRQHQEQALRVDRREDERERRDRQVQDRPPRDLQPEQVERQPVQHAQRQREEQGREDRAEPAEVDERERLVSHLQDDRVEREEGRRVAVHERRLVAVQRDLPVPDAVPRAEVAEERPGGWPRAVAAGDPGLHREQERRHDPRQREHHQGVSVGRVGAPGARQEAELAAAPAGGSRRSALRARARRTRVRAVVLSPVSALPAGPRSGDRLAGHDREDVAEVHADLARAEAGGAGQRVGRPVGQPAVRLEPDTR